MKLALTVLVVILVAQLAAGSDLLRKKHDQFNAQLDGHEKEVAEPREVIWSEKSKFPFSVQMFFAATWVLFLSSLPFILPVLTKQPVTRSQKILGGIMLVVLWGGLFLFTNIILFQSIHFKTIRPLTIVECIYFMAQVITTVGYGDITPAKPRGQVFVGLYVLGALTIIANLISDFINYLVHKFEAGHGYGKHDEITLATMARPAKPKWDSVLKALAIFAFFDVLWIAFFSLHPDEGKTFFQCVYMSVITLSTVGFGWFTPVTEEGMVFGAFLMICGSSALVGVIGQFTDIMVGFQRYEKWGPDHSHESYGTAVKHLKEIAVDGDTMTEAQFIRFVLLHTEAVPEDLLDDVISQFNSCKPTKGVATMKSVENFLQREYEEAATEAD